MGTSMPFGASPEGEPVHEGGGDRERAAEERKVRSDGRLHDPVRFGQADDWAAAIRRRSAPDCLGPYATTP